MDQQKYLDCLKPPDLGHPTKNFIDGILKLISFKTSFAQKLHFITAPNCFNEAIIDYEAKIKEENDAEIVQHKSEVLFGMKIYQFACQGSYILTSNEQIPQIPFQEKLSRLKTSMEIDKDFEKIFQPFESQFKIVRDQKPLGETISFNSYIHWTFCIHGITYIHELQMNFSKCFDWYIKFLTFVNLPPRSEFFPFEEDFLFHYYPTSMYWTVVEKLDPNRQASLKQALFSLFENSKEVKEIEFNYFKIKTYYAYGQYKKCLKIARQALRNVRNCPKIVSDYEYKILHLQDSYNKYPNGRDAIRLYSLEMGLKVEDQILLQIAWIHLKLGNYDLSLDILLKIRLEYLNDDCTQRDSNLIAKPFILFQIGMLFQKLKMHVDAKDFFCMCNMIYSKYNLRMTDINRKLRVTTCRTFFGEYHCLVLIYFQASYMIHISLASAKFQDCQKAHYSSRRNFLNQRKKIRLKLNSEMIFRKINHAINTEPRILEENEYYESSRSEYDQSELRKFLFRSLCLNGKAARSMERSLSRKPYR